MGGRSGLSLCKFYRNMAKVAFVNYRRDDAGAEALLVASMLRQALGDDAVFMDTSSIQSGVTWPDGIRAALAETRYLIVIIGPDWLRAGMSEWGQRRIDDDSDWVRQEIAAAVRDNAKIIIPLLVRGARMPPSNVLPKDICALCSKQAIEIRRDYWHQDIQLLINRISQNIPDHISRSPLSVAPPANPVLASVWDILAPDLQDAFALAANAARREGKDIISTRTFFSALRRLHPGKLQDFFDQIPADAMPEPISDAIQTRKDDLADIRQLSSCVEGSLNVLVLRRTSDDRLTSEDCLSILQGMAWALR
jgi:TIR domain-containing protein